MLTFEQTVRARCSIRAFEPTPVPEDLLVSVLQDAQFAPSNCNTQPWQVHIVSGAKRDVLSNALLQASQTGSPSPDFSWDESAFTGRMGERRRAHGKVYYESLGVARDDHEQRRQASARNFSFFGAPHVALLFMPAIGDSVRVAGDVGMYGQTFLLSLTARGLGGVPQTVLGLYACTIRETLGISPDLKLLYGISFGYPEAGSPANVARVGRDPFVDSVTFHPS